MSEVCHVCGNKKRSYTLYVDGDIFTWEQRDKAIRGGPICNRCNLFFAITGELREPSHIEFVFAIDAMRSFLAIDKLWGKDKSKLLVWPGKEKLIKIFIESRKRVIV